MPGVGLVAELTEISSAVSDSVDARRLQAPAVDAAQAVDALDQLRRLALVRARVAAHSTSWSSGCSRSASEAALTVCSAETTRTPSGAISAACCAAEPCHTPSMRVALPPTAAASGTVASISSWPGAQRLLEVGQRLGLAAEGHAEDTIGAAAAASAFSRPLNAPSGTARARARGRLLGARSASREPITTGTPARASRRARPKPSAPEAPMIATGSEASDARRPSIGFAR